MVLLEDKILRLINDIKVSYQNSSLSGRSIYHNNKISITASGRIELIPPIKLNEIGGVAIPHLF